MHRETQKQINLITTKKKLVIRSVDFQMVNKPNLPSSLWWKILLCDTVFSVLVSYGFLINIHNKNDSGLLFSYEVFLWFCVTVVSLWMCWEAHPPFPPPGESGKDFTSQPVKPLGCGVFIVGNFLLVYSTSSLLESVCTFSFLLDKLY